MPVIFAYDRNIVAVNQIWNVSNIRKISEYRMPCKSVWSLSSCFIRTSIYLNRRTRIEEPGTLRFTLVKLADYKM